MSCIREVCEYIYRLEKELGLIELRYEGSYPYSFLRTRVITEVEKQLGLLTTPHDIPPRRTRWQRYWDFLVYDLKFLLHRKTYDTIVIEHERQILVDGKYIDIYSDDFVQKRIKHESVLCMRRSPNRETKNAKGKQILLRQGFLDRFDGELQRLKRCSERLPLLDEFSQRINAQFGTNLDVNAMFLEEWPKFIRTKRRFLRWLDKYKPSEVVVVVGYYCYEYIEACKDRNIKVSELQHGIIDRNHSGYSFPHHAEVPYFVDRMYLFQSYWKEVCPIPLREDQMEVVGFAYFRDQRMRYALKKHPYQVLVLSQGTIGEQLMAYVIALAKTYPEYVFVYKLHPGEFLQVKERYPNLEDAPENLLVVKNEIPLYQWMSDSMYVLGAYSTAIYEALAMQCQVMLLAVEGVEDYMGYLIDHHYVTLVREVEDFMTMKDQWSQTNGKHNNVDIFF